MLEAENRVSFLRVAKDLALQTPILLFLDQLANSLETQNISRK